MENNRTSICAKVIADSVHAGSRLTTFELTFPRFLLAEFNTHRVLSKNSASSRAIPVWKRLVEISTSPFIPLQFGKNKAGMQSEESISDSDAEIAKQNWLVGRDVALIQAYFLAGCDTQIMKDSKGHPGAVLVCNTLDHLMDAYPSVASKMMKPSVGIHKQHANRVLEPYAYHTVIATGTQWRNFYALRASLMAQPEIQDLAILMAGAHLASVSNELNPGEWHLPYILPEDKAEEKDSLKLARISSGRSSRVSYLTHDGKRLLSADLKQADDLQGSGHTSPFEHPAKAREESDNVFSNSGGNFGNKWTQYRKMLPGEFDFSKLITKESLFEGMKRDQDLVDFVLSLPE